MQRAHIENRRMAEGKHFAAWMIGEIARVFARVVRIHTAGDFYSAEYVRKWLKVVRACPAVTFYAYTRSWRKPAIARALAKLGCEPNMVLWYSCDRETGEPPAYARPRAWMMVNDQDAPLFPVDLVFRVDDRTLLRRVAGVQVCKYELGDKNPKPTCSQCQLCFKKELYEKIQTHTQSQTQPQAREGHAQPGRARPVAV